MSTNSDHGEPSHTEYSMIEPNNSKKLQIAYRKRARLLDNISNSISHFQTSIPDRIYHLILKDFEYYESIQESIDELLFCSNSTDDLADATSAQFRALHTEFLLKCKAITSEPIPAISNAKSNVNLPKLSLPTFSGQISEWNQFLQMFSALIHENSQLTNIERFHYLKSCLRGSALSMLNNLDLSNENYTIAFDLLRQRFSHPRRLCAYYIDQLIEFKPLMNSDYNSLKDYIDSHTNCISALKAQSINNLSDFLLLSISLKHLDSKTRLEFESTIESDRIPSCEELIDFIVKKVRTFELINSSAAPISNSKEKSENNYVKSFRSLVTTSEDMSPVSSVSQCQPVQTSTQSNHGLALGKKCLFCGSESHLIHSCHKFNDLSISQRYTEIRKQNRCFNCFGLHSKKDCKSTKSCRTCHSSSHHSLLHSDSPASAEEKTPQVTVSCNSVTNSNSSNCLLGTANVVIFDRYNRKHTVRAVIDSASQISAISTRLSQRLHLRSQPSSQQLVGIGSRSTTTQGIVDITVSSLIEPSLKLKTKALILPQITCAQPASNLDPTQFKQFSDLKLADSQFFISKPIDVLLGADLFLEIVNTKTHQVITGSPGALETRFGFIILGSLPDSVLKNNSKTSLITSVEPISNMLQKFWESEEISPLHPVKDPDIIACETLYNETTTQLSDGRYEVALPFKNSISILGENRSSAAKKFISLEKRLTSNPSMQDLYHKFMQQYIELGHMSTALNSSSYIIPHHCVMKESSTTTKLRVVFNGSSPCTNGISLNEALLPGPKLQNELSHILINFRLHKIVLTCDIKMMYRQILVRPTDCCFQHIFYRSSPKEEIQEWELRTVTYGLVPSAFLAQKTLLKLVEDHGSEFPLASNAIKNHAYVDDVITGSSSLPEAKELIRQLTTLMSKGKLELRKWASNNPDAIAEFSDEFLENPLAFSDHSQQIKVLGFQFNPSSDSFSYVVSPFNETPTKRSILSYTAKLFDPLGLLAPLVFSFKYFLKLLWIANLDWDTLLPPALLQQWNAISSSIHIISELHIPRHIQSNQVCLSLIGFCDASSKGYAACFYLHVSTHEKFVSMKLICAKTRVAPLKCVTIPRLELCAALLLSKLYKYVYPIFAGYKMSNIRLLTDAKLVLTWLRTPPHTLKTYVANRVTNILEITSPDNWSYIPTEQNPADVASRGISPEGLLSHSQWWNGPAYYRTLPSEWPSNHSSEVLQEIPESKSEPTVLAVIVTEKSYLLCRLENISSFRKANRIFAYILRFISHCKRNARSRQSQMQASLPLNVEEINEARDTIVRLTQEYYFAETLNNLRHGKSISDNLLPLSPFLDPQGLLRVGGRIRHASLPYDNRHPLLLPKKSHLSNLICDQTHTDNMHAGPRTTQSLILQNYWIISLRTLLRQRIRQCVKCTRFRAITNQPLMSDLPEFRINVNPVFSHVGLDFAGPFITKASPIRGTKTYKGYLAIFVCLTVKAVHLEYVSELTSQAFLAAFDRFISRRGLPFHVYSDNGLNFTGASNTLNDVYRFLSNNEPQLHDEFVKRKIIWHFNPPHAPNFGGIWEAAVKSAKILFRNVIGDSPLTMEEFTTVFARIEAILNSRPLLDFSPDPNEELQPITPGHFLIGRPLLQPLELPLDDSLHPRTRWNRLRQLTQSFWHKWSTDYLHTQIQRKKWNKPSTPLQKGQLVFIKGINTGPMTWPLGRIIDLHPGRDNIDRVATVKTATGLAQRPITKLVPLSIA